MHRSALCSILLAALLTGCAGLPPPERQPPTQALAASADTALGRLALAAQPDRDLSGFRLMPGGDNALNTRLALIARAERTLDVQYYQVENDATGRHFLRALRDAAQRGVRVRLLIDDLYTTGEDRLLLGLAAEPNVELRLFNPFATRGSIGQRFAFSLLDFSRINHRMHNKLFVADGAIGVAGGRNIGDAYFTQTSDANFLDIDTVVAGAVMPRLGELFDLYWNSGQVRPIASVVGNALGPESLRAAFDEATNEANAPAPRRSAPNDALGYAPFTDDLKSGRLDLIWTLAEAYADDPRRVVGAKTSYGGAPLLDVDSVRYNVREQMRRARSDVTLVSPYLIPGQAGLEVLREMHGRGVRIGIVTNSLAATDEPLVYGAYRRYRPEMLGLGAEIWELSTSRASNSVRLGLLGSKVGRLHAKSAVFDGATIFLGSMNLDPRSDIYNTELGLIVFSPELAAQLSRLIEALKQQGAYRVRYGADGKAVEWVSGNGATAQVLQSEPDSDFWGRLRLQLLSPFVPESLL